MRPYTYRILQCFLASVFLLSCSDNLSEAPETGAAQGLSLAFNLNGGSAESSPESDGLKENTVNSLDVLFVKGTAVERHFSYNNSQLSSGSVQIAGNDWKKEFKGEYEVYLVANYDGDLSKVTTKSQLFAAVDQDENITKAQREQSVDDGSEYTGKSFLMDGKTTFNADSDYGPTNQHKIDVNLSRAAAKMTVNLTYGEGFLKTGSSGSRSIVSVQKKLVRYVNEAKIVADGGTIPFADLHGNSDNTGFSYANETNDPGTAGRTDVLYTYCYPNDWTDDIEGRETYLLLNIPYTEGGDQGDPINNYYKIPVRISGVTQQLSIERNTEYTIDVNINRVGSTLLEKPQDLTATISVKPWVSKDVSVSGDNTPKYLELNKTDFEMRNIAEASVTFSSSSVINSVKVDRVYFIDNYSVEQDLDKSLVTIDYDKSVLQGNITVNSPIPTNVKIQYIELTVKNQDNLTQQIKISQYPLEYIVGIKSVYTYRTDLVNNNYDNFVNGRYFDKVMNQITFGKRKHPQGGWANFDFYSKVVIDNKTYNVYVSDPDPNQGKKVKLKAGSNGSDGYTFTMQLLSLTSVREGVTMARPDMETTADGLVVPVSSEENNAVVSPFLILGSDLGYVFANAQGGTWAGAREHCARYVEVIKYADGTTRELRNWRLPSYEEIKIIGEYEQNGKLIDCLKYTFDYYTLQDGVIYYEDDGSGVAWYDVRCVRDITKDDIEEFRSKGLKI